MTNKYTSSTRDGYIGIYRRRKDMADELLCTLDEDLEHFEKLKVADLIVKALNAYENDDK